MLHQNFPSTHMTTLTCSVRSGALSVVKIQQVCDVSIVLAVVLVMVDGAVFNAIRGPCARVGKTQ